MYWRVNMKPKVAFVCVHNSCRSQIAEALGKLLASDVFDSYSGGTQTKPKINSDAVRIIKDLYGIDMSRTQHSKLVDDLPEIDISIKMGCEVVCPVLFSKYEEDWGLEDPTGKNDDEFIITARVIEKKVKNLAKRISNGDIKI